MPQKIADKIQTEMGEVGALVRLFGLFLQVKGNYVNAHHCRNRYNHYRFSNARYIDTIGIKVTDTDATGCIEFRAIGRVFGDAGFHVAA